MRTLMVSPFAPYRDGIATYAMQELRRLRLDGPVDVLSPQPSAARWHLPLGGPKGVLRLAKKASAYDRTVIQFGPELLFGGCGTASKRVAVWAGLAGLARQTSLDLRIHEIEYGPLEQNPLERRAARLALQQADRVTVHTEAELLALDRLLGLGRRVEVVDHGRDFAPAVVRSGPEARAELGLAAQEFIFLSIGFLQHHKGFDLAVEAMAGLGSGSGQPGPQLHIVGSPRIDHPDISGYVDRLERLCRSQPNVTLHNRYVSDVEFDLWLQAADAVVLPYREIWSSGVVERAGLFEVPVLAADLPQLRDQSRPGTVFFTGIDELAVAMDKVWSASPRHQEQRSASQPDPIDRSVPRLPGSVRRSVPGVETSPWTVSSSDPDRAAIQSQIAARARRGQLKSVDPGVDRIGPDIAVPIGRRPVDSLLALGDFHRPRPTSARPGVAPIKRTIGRLIGWQIDPIVARLEDLQRATTQAVAQLDGGDGSEEPAS